jgi:transposase-like protein
MLKYILPLVGQDVKLQRHCPYCHRFAANKHSGIIHRAISDMRITSIRQRRMKCPWCKATWTLRQEGISDGRHRTDRMIAYGVMLYMLGLSCRGVELMLAAWGCKGSNSTIERDVAEAGSQAKLLHQQAKGLVSVRILGVDGTGAKIAGKPRAGLLFFVDVERGKLICVEPVNETDSRKVREHVSRVMEAVGAQQLMTDELSVYDNIVDQQHHKICLAHWRKSKVRRAFELHRQFKVEGLEYAAKDMLELIALLRQDPMPQKIPDSIEKLVRRYINCRSGTLWKANQLLQHIERTWDRVSKDGTDRTNNATERLIGLNYKIRTKMMRGFKSKSKALNHCYLSEYLRGEGGVCDLRKVI